MRKAFGAALLVAAAVSSTAIAGQPARASVEIWSADPIAVTIEHLQIHPDGKETITSRQKNAVGPPVPLQFINEPGRYVRFIYQGASPHTFSAAELAARKKVHVPDILPGGELVLLVPPATVRPVRLQITGTRGALKNVSSEVHVSAAGLPAGQYSVTPIYRGDVKGAPYPAIVRVAVSNVIVMPIEPVGALLVESEAGCGMATSLSVARTGRQSFGGTGPGSTTIVTRGMPFLEIPQPGCRVEIGGLEPSFYDVQYRAGLQGRLGSGGAEVRAQQIARIAIASKLSHVAGRVTLNGRPAALSVIAVNRLAPRPSGVAATVPVAAGLNTMSDADGFFSVTLDEPGDYSIGVRVPSGIVSRDFRVVEGAQSIDVALTAAAIRFRFEGWDRKSKVTVRASAGNKVTVVAWDPAREPEGPTLVGVPYGNLEISIEIDGRGYPGLLRTITVSDAAPEAALTVDLRKR